MNDTVGVQVAVNEERGEGHDAWRKPRGWKAVHFISAQTPQHE